MPFKQHDRQYDLVVLGATGYTGVLTAEHITKHLPTDLRWAVAGRSASKLESVVEECKQLNADRVQPSIEIANIDDQTQLNELAQKAYIIITTVGPYCQYGEPVIKACVDHGTHYFDVTGEFPWTYKMIKKYQQAAETSGALIFPQIGIESAPPDICTYALTKIIREELGEKTGEVTINLHKLSAKPSGGTLASVFAVLDNFSLKEIRASSAPFSLSPMPHSPPHRPAKTLTQKLLGPTYVPNLGFLSTSIAGTTDRPVVERTWGLLGNLQGREDEFYGPNFRWRELSTARGWLGAIRMHWGLAIASLLIAVLSPLRTWLRPRVTQPGSGPSREAMAKEKIEYRGVASPDSDKHPGKQAYVRAAWNGGMYDVTALFLGQAALTLLKDDGELGLTKGGFYTPACLGQAFIDRCGDRGFKVEVKLIKS